MTTYKWICILLLLPLSACSNEKSGSMAPDMATSEYENIDIESPRTTEPPGNPNYTLYDSDGNGASQAQDGRGSSQQSEQLAQQPRKIIKTANYRFRVEELDKSASAVETLVEQHGGYITKLEQNNSNYELNTEVTIRVPADKFDDLLDALGGESVFTNYKRIEARDVSEEYYDVETRLQTKKDVRDRYVELLRNKAKTVEEVLLAEEQIRVIQEEIDSKEGRLRFLKDRVAMSTINLEMYQTVEYRSEPSTYKRSFWKDLGNSFRNGGEMLGELFLGLISIWPLVIIIGLLIWKGGWLWRRIRR